MALDDQHEDQVADGFPEVNRASVDRRQQQTVQAAAVFFDGHRAVQSERAGEGEGDPQHTGGNAAAGGQVQLERKVEDQDDQQGEYQHGREQFAAAQLGRQVLPDHRQDGLQKAGHPGGCFCFSRAASAGTVRDFFISACQRLAQG